MDWPGWPAAPPVLMSLQAPALAGLVVFGGLLSTYTGVLLAATVVPAWNRHRRTLPVHFGLASLACAAGWLLVLGVRDESMVNLMVFALLMDLLVEAYMLWEERGDGSGFPFVTKFLRSVAVVTIAIAGAWLGFAQWAAVLVLISSLLGRFEWVDRGRVDSGR